MLTLEKKCNACGVVKNLIDFQKASTCADGHRNKCKECTYERQKAWKSDNKERYLQHQRNYNRRKSEDREFKKEKSIRGRLYRTNNPQKMKLKAYVAYDKKRGLDNNLDLEFCVEVMKRPCIYCGFIEPLCNGLDRIDNSKGHTKSNCVPCCKLCNVTRMDNYSHQEFLEYIAPGIVALRKSRGEI